MCTNLQLQCSDIEIEKFIDVFYFDGAKIAFFFRRGPKFLQQYDLYKTPVMI